MLILTKQDIKELFTMNDAITATKAALRMHSEGKSIVPLRTNIEISKAQGQSLFMPAYVEEINAVGIKIVSVFPNNIRRNKPSVPAQMILLDGETGEVCALIDGTYLTQLRTGALQGAATDILARSSSKKAVLFGTGGQAATQLEAMLTVRNLDEINVIDIDWDRAQQFAKTMQQEFIQSSARIVAMKDGNEAIKDADIITAVTTSRTSVFDGALVKKGTHVNGIGAYTPDMQELPENLINVADKIFFDTKEGVLAEAGDIIIPMQAGTITEANFSGNLGEILVGNIAGRETEKEITVFKAVGTALLDVVTAHAIYKKALEVKKGQFIKI